MNRKELIEKLKNTPRYRYNGKVYTPDQEVFLIVDGKARLIEDIEFGSQALYINARKETIAR